MLSAFDVGVGILVLISAILATARGLTREVLALLTWAGSAAVAVYLWQYHLDLVYPGLIGDEYVAIGALVVVSFIVSLIVLHLLTMWIADVVVESRIGPLDRTLGFVFGAARGVLIAIIVVIFGTWLIPDVENQSWAKDSKTIPPLRQFGMQIIDLLPENLAKQITDVLEGRDTARPIELDALLSNRTTNVNVLLAVSGNLRAVSENAAVLVATSGEELTVSLIDVDEAIKSEIATKCVQVCPVTVTGQMTQGSTPNQYQFNATLVQISDAAG